MDAGPFACQCCGHRTLAEAPNGWTLVVCEVCGWDDSWEHGPMLRSFEDLELEAAQRAYVATGSVHPSVAELVRQPRPEEARDAAFGYAWEVRERVAAAIREAFAGIRRAGGMSLYDAEVADMYGHVGDYLKPAMREVPERWEDLEPHHFTDFPHDGAPVFLDARGFRFYLPALMLFFIEDRRLVDASSWVFCLHHYRSQQRALRALLTPAQKAAIAGWIRLLLSPPRARFQREDLERALELLHREDGGPSDAGDEGEEDGG